jgi:uncharacterized Zn finger protein (UPF0148 family)
VSLYVYCHNCNRRVGVVTTDDAAREMAENHTHEDVSWSGEPVEKDDETGGGDS